MTPDPSPNHLEEFPHTFFMCGACLNDTEQPMHIKYTSFGGEAAAKTGSSPKM